jgi:hypothetical protein
MKKLTDEIIEAEATIWINNDGEPAFEDGGLIYSAQFKDNEPNVDFFIPFNETDGAVFFPETEAQLLIRWIDIAQISNK